MGIEPDNKVGDNHYYRSESNQLETQFDGELARMLGIDGTFTLEADDRLFRGYYPQLSEAGAEIKLAKRIDSNRIGAVDWTFNRPKSVSALKLVGGDSRIDEVECRAELAALKMIESQARVMVRKKGEIAKSEMPEGWKYPERKSGNILFVRYRHPASRDDDPHSHTHAKIFNLSFDPEEKIVKALELRYVNRKKVNELYRDELRIGLHQLGYKTEMVGQEFEIVGFPAEVKAKYSQRGEAIGKLKDAMEQKIGKAMSSKAKGKLSVYGRPEKPDDRPIDERREGWLERITREHAEHLRELVESARLAVSFDRFKEGLKRHASKLRQSVIHEPDRGIDRGITR